MFRNACTLLAAGILFSSVSLAQAGGGDNRTDWTGIYVGAHIGGAWGESDRDNGSGSPGVLPMAQLELHSNADLDGFLGGGHLGANYQTGKFVIGAEISYSGGNIDGSSGPSDLTNNLFNDEVSDDVKSLFQAVVRFGYSFDKALVYGKVGYASADIDSSVLSRNLTNTDGGTTTSVGGREKRHGGLVLGAGLEYAFAPSFVFGVDYAYINLRSERHELDLLTQAGAATGQSVSYDVDPNIHAITARFSYKFGQ